MPVLSKDELGAVIPLHPRLQGLAGQSLGRYLVDAIVQISHAGAEYVGREEESGDEVRIVVLDPLSSASDAHVRGVARLKRCVGRIQHPGCQQILGHGMAGGLEFLVCSPDVGIPLAHRMRGPVRPAVVERLAMALLGVLIHLHERDLVHGDVRPANVLIDPDSENFTMLTGLGVETRLLGDPIDDGPRPTGSAFLSPERVAGDAIDTRSDLYSLGLTLRVLLLGQPARDLRPAIAGGTLEDRNSLDRWLTTLTAQAPHDRFPSAAHALEQLRAFKLLESARSRPPERQPGIVSGELHIQTTDRIETGIVLEEEDDDGEAAEADPIQPFDSTTATQPERRAPGDPRASSAAADSGLTAVPGTRPRMRVGWFVLATSVLAIAATSVVALTYGDRPRPESVDDGREPAIAAAIAITPAAPPRPVAIKAPPPQTPPPPPIADEPILIEDEPAPPTEPTPARRRRQPRAALAAVNPNDVPAAPPVVAPSTEAPPPPQAAAPASPPAPAPVEPPAPSNEPTPRPRAKPIHAGDSLMPSPPSDPTSTTGADVFLPP